MRYSKTGAVLFSLSFSIMVFSPVVENWKAKPKDSFPLSYYPMFAKKRDANYSLYYLVGYDENENRYLIHYKYIGTGGFNQVRRQIRKMAKQEQGDQLLKKAAERLATVRKTPYNQIQRIELVKGTYHLEDYFLNNNQEPLKEKLIASQKIARP